VSKIKKVDLVTSRSSLSINKKREQTSKKENNNPNIEAIKSTQNIKQIQKGKISIPQLSQKIKQ